MKRNLRRIIIIVLCAAVGWTIGFLRLPYIEKNHSFWVGFLGCIGFVSLIIALLLVWNKYSLLIRIVGKNKSEDDSRSAKKTYRFIGALTLLLIITGWVFSSIVFYNQNEQFEAKSKRQNQIIEEQSALIESIRNENMGMMLSNVMGLVDEDLRNSADRSLSKVTMNRIAALSYSLSPYKYMEGDSLSAIKLSPERGQLLLALAIVEMDSSSFEEIKRNTSFAGADLRGANFRGADLSGIDLTGADMTSAELEGVNLSDAALKGAKLWGADLNNADLSGANLKRSDLSWTDMNDANLRSADLNGSNLTNAQLIKADLRKATFQWTEMSGAVLRDADLKGGDLFGAVLTKANLTNANLTDVLLRRADLTDAILIGTELSGTDIEADWFDKLIEWNTIGSNPIKESYKVVDITPGKDDASIYNLKKIHEHSME